LAFSPDGSTLAVSAAYGAAVLHDLVGTGPPVSIGTGRTEGQTALGFEAGGRIFAAVIGDGRARFDRATGAQLGAVLRDPDGRGLIVSFDTTADGRRLVTTQFEVGRHRVCGWDAIGDDWSRVWAIETGDASEATVSPTGERTAVVAFPTPGEWGQPRLLIHDAATGKPVDSKPYPFLTLPTPRFRPDGRQIVAVHDHLLVVWDIRMPGKPVQVRNDSRKHFTAAAYHPSGRYLFTTSNDATVTVWDTENWVRLNRYDWDVGRLRAVAVSPDGLTAAAGSDRGRVVVWDVDL
jgi:WD40 repeat protein